MQGRTREVGREALAGSDIREKWNGGVLWSKMRVTMTHEIPTCKTIVERRNCRQSFTKVEDGGYLEAVGRFIEFTRDPLLDSEN